MPPKRKTQPKSKSASNFVAVIPEPGYDGSFSTAYANFASISHTSNELCIDFCLVAPPHDVDIEEGVVRAPVVSRVLIPPNLVEGLIKALGAQRKKLDQALKNEIPTSAVKKAGKR